VIGPYGKVVHFYPGNDWNVQDVLADLNWIVISNYSL